MVFLTLYPFVKILYGYSWLTMLLHLGLTKTLASTYTCEWFFLIGWLDVRRPTLYLDHTFGWQALQKKNTCWGLIALILADKFILSLVLESNFLGSILKYTKTFWNIHPHRPHSYWILWLSIRRQPLLE